MEQIAQQDFTDCRPERFEYEGVQFCKCTFLRSDLSGVSFTDCLFDTCLLSGVILTNTRFCDVTFRGSKLMGLNFSAVTDFPFSPRFEGCLLEFCDFTARAMEGVALLDSRLRECSFIDCDLRRADFSGSDLQRTSVRGCRLEGADLRRIGAYSISPAANRMKGARLAAHHLTGLLDEFYLRIE
ncbi:MAG: pentapeptide repeat-containing protein [Fibrobacterota bacterium]